MSHPACFFLQNKPSSQSPRLDATEAKNPRQHPTPKTNASAEESTETEEGNPRADG